MAQRAPAIELPPEAFARFAGRYAIEAKYGRLLQERFALPGGAALRERIDEVGVLGRDRDVGLGDAGQRVGHASITRASHRRAWRRHSHDVRLGVGNWSGACWCDSDF